MARRYVEPPSENRIRIIHVRRQRTEQETSRRKHGVQDTGGSVRPVREQKPASMVQNRHGTFVKRVRRPQAVPDAAAYDSGNARATGDMAFSHHR